MWLESSTLLKLFNVLDGLQTDTLPDILHNTQDLMWLENRYV